MNVSILRRERTDELKAKRKLYGDNSGKLHFSEHKWVPRPDGVTNTITSFDKDNYMLITY